MAFQGPKEDYDAIYGVHGPGEGIWEFDSPDKAHRVIFGLALTGSAIGAGIAALVLGGNSRLLAMVGGAGGALMGGVMTKRLAEKIVVYKRLTASPAELPPSPTTSTSPPIDKNKIIDVAAELE